MTEPVECRTCRRKPFMYASSSYTDKGREEWYYYGCHKADCWAGPKRKTRGNAINAWNKVMEVK